MSPRHWTASMLRRDLYARAEQLARTNNLLHDVSTGSSPAVLFGCDERGRHGNFHPASYERIRSHPDWARRLAKVHTASRRSRARHDWRWMELDSCCSSDALLMNIFCHPEVFDGAQLSAPVAGLLHVHPSAHPEFGRRIGVPLRAKPKSHATTDRTEVDLALGDLLMEAKLTENDFQTAPARLVERYRDLEQVFDVSRLRERWFGPHQLPGSVDPDDPAVHVAGRKAEVRIDGYQLIRTALAAFATDASVCVLCDGRRHDLIECWYAVMSAIQVKDFTWRLKLLTWQELVGVLPSDLRDFLGEKYGIEP